MLSSVQEPQIPDKFVRIVNKLWFHLHGRAAMDILRAPISCELKCENRLSPIARRLGNTKTTDNLKELAWFYVLEPN